jgi:hypothetical protein
LVLPHASQIRFLLADGQRCNAEGIQFIQPRFQNRLRSLASTTEETA